MAEPIRIQLRRDVSTSWATSNPILAEGEAAVDTTTGIVKIGNGVDPFSDLGSAIGGVTYADHGSVSGPITAVATVDTHALTMTADTSVTISGGENGRTVQVFATGNYVLTVEGQNIPTGRAIAIRVRDAWLVYVLGGAGDAIPPTAGVLTANVTDTEASLSVAGALDTGVGLHASPYAFSSNGGSTWSAWQTASSVTLTGLTPSTSYTFQHRVRDAVGNISNGTASTQSTLAAMTWVTKATWTFTRADNTELNALAPDTGSGVALAGPATNLGSSPQIHSRVVTNKAQVQTSGAVSDYTLISTTAYPYGIAIQYDSVVFNNTFCGQGKIQVGTVSANNQWAGVTVSATTGVITADDFSAGDTTYTPEPGAPGTVVPKTCTIRVEARPGSGNIGCSGKVYVDGVLWGRFTSTVWTWQGKAFRWSPLSNSSDSTYDNLKFEALE